MECLLIRTTTEYRGHIYDYRLFEDENGTTIRRTLAIDPLWTHGVLCQTYSCGKFCMMAAGNPDRLSYEEAERIIYADNEINA